MVSESIFEFFGLNDLKEKLEFKGAVTVDVALNELGINQCPDDFTVANAFKNTARCDYETQFCEPIESTGFVTGKYKCNCRQGFEYTYLDSNWYFDGQMMEKEYKAMMRGQPNRFESLKCRIAGASSHSASVLLMNLMMCAASLWT